MSTNAKAVGYLELNINGFDQALKTAKNLMAGFAAGFTAYKIGQFFQDGIKDAIDFGREMQSASRAMGGFDPGKLLLVQKALERAGMGAEEARGHVADFIREGRDVSDIFSGTENYASALKSAAADYGSQASILTRSAKALRDVWNTMESIGSKLRTFFMGMTESFVRPLQYALNSFNEIDLAGIGAGFGKAVSDAAMTIVGVFKNGDIYEFLRLGTTLAFQESINWLVGGLNYAAGYASTEFTNSMIDAWNESVSFFCNLWNTIASNEIAQGIYHGAISAYLKGIQFYLTAWAEVKEYVQASLTWAGNTAVVKTVEAFRAIMSPEFWSWLAGKMWEAFKKTIGLIKDAMIESFKAAVWFLVEAIPMAVKKAKEKIGEWVSGAKESKYKSFEDIKNSPEVRADWLRQGAGWVGEIADNQRNLAQPGLSAASELLSGASKKVAAAFEKGNAFDTSKGWERLANIWKDGAKTANGFVSQSSDPAKGVLTAFSSGGSNARVIADNLAKVGGGGGYLRVGMSLAERTQMEISMAAKQTAKATATLVEQGKEKPKQAVLGRGR